jgi:hypothetical protein
MFGIAHPVRFMADVFVYVCTVATATIWKSTTSRKIRQILGCDPKRDLYLKDAGLIDTFEMEWPRVAVPAVVDFVNGFHPEVSKVKFRGRIFDWDCNALREAFRLPSAENTAAWRPKWTGSAIDGMFTVPKKASNPYVLASLKPAFNNLKAPIRLIQELLLGKSKATGVHGKQMWVYWSCWWRRIDRQSREGVECPQLKPDWARLVLEDLTAEILLLTNHLLKDPPPKKRYAVNCGTAITKFLLHKGYSIEQLNEFWTEDDEDVRAREAVEEGDGDVRAEEPMEEDNVGDVRPEEAMEEKEEKEKKKEKEEKEEKEEREEKDMLRKRIWELGEKVSWWKDEAEVHIGTSNALAVRCREMEQLAIDLLRRNESLKREVTYWRSKVYDDGKYLHWFSAFHSLVHVWFTYGSRMVHVWFMYGSRVVHVMVDCRRGRRGQRGSRCGC